MYQVLREACFKWRKLEMAHFESEILAVGGSVAREVVGTRSVSARIISAVVAIALGLTIISVVGFAPNDFIHAAAHDVRHSAGFPCH
jgi:cobalt transporter subunit CbtB